MQKILIFALAGLFWLGCGGSKTVVRDEKAAAESPLAAGTPDTAPNTVVISPHWLDKSTLEIDFLADKITARPVFGTAINLQYDPRIIEYASYKEGGFLEQGGIPAGSQKPVYLVSRATPREAGKSELVIGVSLFRGTPGVTGSGKLFILKFTGKQALPTEIKITKGKLKGLQADDITEIHWPASIPIPSP